MKCRQIIHTLIMAFTLYYNIAILWLLLQFPIILL